MINQFGLARVHELILRSWFVWTQWITPKYSLAKWINILIFPTRYRNRPILFTDIWISDKISVAFNNFPKFDCLLELKIK